MIKEMLEQINIPLLNVRIKKEAYNKIIAEAIASPGECSGFGMIKMIGDTFEIYDIVVPKQINTRASTTIDPDDLVSIILELDEQGKTTEDWHCWWHSHADSNVFYSGTDEDTIANVMNYFSKDYRYLVSIVVNKRCEITARIDIDIKAADNYYIRVTHYVPCQIGDAL